MDEEYEDLFMRRIEDRATGSCRTCGFVFGDLPKCPNCTTKCFSTPSESTRNPYIIKCLAIAQGREEYAIDMDEFRRDFNARLGYRYRPGTLDYSKFIAILKMPELRTKYIKISSHGYKLFNILNGIDGYFAPGDHTIIEFVYNIVIEVFDSMKANHIITKNSFPYSKLILFMICRRLGFARYLRNFHDVVEGSNSVTKAEPLCQMLVDEAFRAHKQRIDDKIAQVRGADEVPK